MRKNENGGYLLQLTPGQLKKWPTLLREMVVEGTIVNKKWEDTSYELTLAGDTYAVAAKVNQAKNEYAVTIKCGKETITQTYKTYECNDCVIRLLLQLHNERKQPKTEKKEKAKGKTA